MLQQKKKAIESGKYLQFITGDQFGHSRSVSHTTTLVISARD